MGTLFIVATPIGNLKDLSLRAIDVLTKVGIIACEDTRVTGFLLKHIKQLRHSGNQGKPEHPESLPHPNPLPKGERGVRGQAPLAGALVSLDASRSGSAKRARMTDLKATLLSYYEQNELRRIPQVLNALKNGVDVALVSDAGTPTISDPGFKLVRECIAQGIKVESIPGPSSVISSLVTSGLPTDKFLFLGYLPKKAGRRKKLLNELKCFKALKQVHPTIVFFESPYRLIETLSDVKGMFGDIDIVVARELTKIHEEIRREKISESVEHFNKTQPKGELVVLFKADIF